MRAIPLNVKKSKSDEQMQWVLLFDTERWCLTKKNRQKV